MNTDVGQAWRAGFLEALTHAVVNNGYPVRPDADEFGWRADDWEAVKARVAAIGVNYEATRELGPPREAQWPVFTDTFAESGDTRHGVDVTLVLHDGTKVEWRYEATIGDLIRNIVIS